MDGPRDYHTKWNKPDREGQISYDIAHMWNLKEKTMTQMNLFPKQKETHRHRKPTYGYQRGKGGQGRDKLGGSD